MSLKRNLIYNSILSISQLAFPLLSIPYISRVLDPECIGKVSFIDSLTYYFIVIAEFGIVTYGIREVARKRNEPEALRRTISDLLSLHMLTSFVSLLLYSVLIVLLYHRIGDLRIILFSVSFLIVNSFACEWYFWGTEQFRYITLRSLLARVLGLASIFLLIKQPQDFYIYYAIISGTAIVNILLNFFKMNAEVSISFRNIQWKNYLPSLKITYQISLVYSVVLMLDNVFLGIVSTTGVVAYYAFATKLVRMSGAVVTDTLLVFYPRSISLLNTNSNEAYKSTLAYSSQLIILSTIPMAVGILLLAKKFTLVYFGVAFLPLATNLKILALYPFLKAYGLFLNKQLLMPNNRERLILNGLWISTVVFICLAIPLSYFWADQGMSIAVMISEVAVVAANVYFVKRLRLHVQLLQTRVLWEAIAGSLLFIPIMYLFGLLLLNPILEVVFTVITCILFYLMFLLWVTRNKMVIALLGFRRRFDTTLLTEHEVNVP